MLGNESAVEIKERHPLAAGRRSDDKDGPTAEIPPRKLEPVLDQATIRQLRDTLTPDMRGELVDVFDAQRAKCVSELARAVRCGDRGEIRRVAHLLEGSSASLGAMALRAACEALERVSRSGDADVAQSQVEELSVLAAAASRALREQLV
jgi:HPt (histidine-containing phosphotransfer) domain-containing protein